MRLRHLLQRKNLIVSKKALLITILTVISFVLIHSITEARRSSQLIDYDRVHLKYIYPELIDQLFARTNLRRVSWSKYAYVLYAITLTDLCNSMMIFHELKTSKTKADFVLIIDEGLYHGDDSSIIQSYKKHYNIKFKPKRSLVPNTTTHENADQFMKLYAFNETDYERVIYLDNNVFLSNYKSNYGNLDELFLLPSVKLAGVLNWWESRDFFMNNKPDVSEDLYDEHLISFKQREDKIDSLVKNLHDVSLPIRNEYDRRNFDNEFYNSLPNFDLFDDSISILSMVMVIQPSNDDFNRLNKTLASIDIDRYDLNIIEKLLLKPIDMISNQISKSLTMESNFELLREDIPELLILPQRVYGAVSDEFNKIRDHRVFYADIIDQPFIQYDEKDVDLYYDLSKYADQSEVLIPFLKIVQINQISLEKLKLKNTEDIENDKTELSQSLGNEDGKKEEFYHVIHLEFNRLREKVCKIELMDFQI